MGPRLSGFARMTPLLHGNGFDARDQTVDRDADAIEGAVTRAVAATGARLDALVEEIFDKRLRFVLDIKNFSSIIYIWYEGGQLRPALVRLARIPSSTSHLFVAVAELNRNSGSPRRYAAEGAPKRRAPISGERARRQPY
jgi:hypothetical protein